MIRHIAKPAAAAVMGLGFAALTFAAAAAAEVNVYSARKEHLIKPQLDSFTDATGITVNLVTGSAGELMQRLQAEGANSPADLLLTVDAGNLVRAKEAGLLQPVESEVLNAAIPAQFRDADGAWFGLGQRARVIFYNPDRVDPSELASYEDLADPKWKGRIAIRSSNNIYNQSLLASLIHHLGAEGAEDWARGVVANMARKPQGGDRDQIKAVAAGEADIAVANTYYWGQMATGDDAEREAAAAVAALFPNQDGRGAHVNISGGGVTASAGNADEAVQLLEFLAGDEAQRIYAEKGFEYPVKPGVPTAEIIAGLGDFKADDLPMSVLGDNNAAAVRIFDRVGWR